MEQSRRKPLAALLFLEDFFMDHIFESATERLKRELDDKYQVVFDDSAGKYFVLRWRQTGCGQGYYAVQGRGFDTWDEDRIIEYFRHGHWRSANLTDREFEREGIEDRERVEQETDATLTDLSEELGKDILAYYQAPVVRSIPGCRNTRLQE
jgi:hypothetical protein